MPKVSVIIPAYNRAQFLPRAIDSVLAQTYKDYEIIVVDDGSTDNTRDVLKQYNGEIKYIRQDNGGSSSARNRGILESLGEYIAFLDSDDVWMPEKLEVQVEVLDTHKDVGLVYSQMPIFDNKGKQIGLKPADPIGNNFDELIEGWGDLPTSTVLTRRECFDKAGLFDTNLITVQDFDMWLRISRFYSIYECKNKHLAHYFRHGTQNTSNWANVLTGLLLLYMKIERNYKHLPNFPHQVYRKKIASHYYWLSKELYHQKHYREALSHLWTSLVRYPLIGPLFFKENDNMFKKMFILIKPYGYFIICTLKWCFQGLRNLFLKTN